jgi:uncharacterized RDD family membrane protein YckC
MSFSAELADVRVTGRRVVATLIDAAAFGVIASVFNLTDKSGFDLTTLAADNWWLLLGVAAYYILLEGFTGRTLGKLLAGIRVVDARTGGRPGLLSGISRTALRLIDGIFAYLVGFIIVLNSDRRRRLGDMAAKTLVVRA